MNYFDLYYAYLAQCEQDNWANMRDPNHDYMEWNHTLPQCIFGDQPIGQWLTIEQHAIASALQTLAYNSQCHCGWHKKHMPEDLWEMCLPYYQDNGRKSALLKTFEQRSAAGKVGGRAGWKTCKEKQVGYFDPRFKSEWSSKGGQTRAESGELAIIASSGGLASGRSRWMDPDHPDLGAHHHITLMKLQRENGYPSTKQNRVRATSEQ